MLANVLWLQQSLFSLFFGILDVTISAKEEKYHSFQNLVTSRIIASQSQSQSHSRNTLLCVE